MFYLEELPSKEELVDLQHRYPNLNASALQTFSVLMKTGSDMIRAFEASLGRLGLSQGKFLILLQLSQAPDGVTGPSDLADRLGVTRATITGLLDGLERDGSIDRFARDGDRRRVGVRLTPAGTRLLDEVLPGYFRSINVVMSKITEAERSHLEALLERMRAGLSLLRRG